MIAVRRLGALLAGYLTRSNAHSIANIIVNSFGTTESRIDRPTSDPIPSSTETQKIGPLHFNEITFLAAHNAHANSFAAGDNIVKQLAANQKYSIYQLLKYFGVRGLLLDIDYDSVDSDIRLVHGSVDFNSFSDILANEITPFLDEDPDAVITLDLETVGDRKVLREQLAVLFDKHPHFAKRIFRISHWKELEEWPTIQQMREADQRVIILCDSGVLQSDELGIMWRNDVVMENHWEGGLDSCINRKGNFTPWASKTIRGTTWSRLFTMNHFCCATGIESFERISTSLVGGGDNGWGVLYPRVMMCTAANGQKVKPNFIATDWTHIGDGLEVSQYLTIGGKVGGIGQSCENGLDCATGSCSSKNSCQCELCNATDTTYCIGCNAGESCIVVREGVHECSSKTLEITQYQWNSSILERKNNAVFVLLTFVIGLVYWIF